MKRKEELQSQLPPDSDIIRLRMNDRAKNREEIRPDIIAKDLRDFIGTGIFCPVSAEYLSGIQTYIQNPGGVPVIYEDKITGPLQGRKGLPSQIIISAYMIISGIFLIARPFDYTVFCNTFARDPVSRAYSPFTLTDRGSCANGVFLKPTIN